MKIVGSVSCRSGGLARLTLEINSGGVVECGWADSLAGVCVCVALC